MLAQRCWSGDRTPAVIFLGGADSLAEELYFLAAQPLRDRGLACLIVDTPGRGACLRLHGVHAQPDYEKPVGVLLDYLQARHDVDPERIGLQQLKWIVGAKDEAQARVRLREFSLRGVAQNITCPLLITHGAEDRIMSVDGAYRLYAEARGPKQLKIWTAAEGGAVHCQWDNLAPALAFMLDWLADQLT